MTQLSWEGPVTRMLGLLAARFEDWERAVAHFEDAIERSRRLGARPHHARIQYELGRALMTRGRLADRVEPSRCSAPQCPKGRRWGCRGWCSSRVRDSRAWVVWAP